MMIQRLFSIGLTAALVLSLSGCMSFFDSDSKSSAPVKTTKTNEQVRSQLSLAVALLMEGDYNRALPELMKAREMDPKNPDVENFLGLAYYNMKNYDLAIESFNKALNYNPNRADVHNNLGLVYLDTQNYEKALSEFNLCVANPEYQKKHLPLSNIGLAYIQMGRYDEAINSLNQAVAADPNYGKSYQLLGRAYLTKGDNRSALTALENALRLDPGDQEAQMLLQEAQKRQR